MVKHWFLDYEAYQLHERTIIKEICILSEDGQHCFNYFIKNPSSLPSIPYCTTTAFQFKRHQLEWNFGDYHFTEAMEDINRKLKFDIVLVKGNEKAKFISGYLNRVVIELVNIPSFKQLKNCMTERCEVKHGNNCARRKVHELKHVFDKQHHVTLISDSHLK